MDPIATTRTALAGVRLLDSARRNLGITTAAEDMVEGIERDAEEFVNSAATDWHLVKHTWDGVPEEERPTPSDIGAVLLEASKVYRGTVGREKRRLLRNAIVNAFDREQYEAGITRRLLRVLDDLEYGDVRFLADLSSQGGRFIDDLGGLENHHHGVAVRHGLVAAENDPGGILVCATELGERLLRLVAEPEGPPSA